jgi:hypothetical protein
MNKSLTVYYFDVAKLSDCQKSFAATARASRRLPRAAQHSGSHRFAA